MDSLWFDDVSVDQIWISPARTVTESDVVNFAAATGDYNPLHVDHQFAASTPFRKPIAHGLLGLAWVAGLGSNSPRMNTVAFTAVNDWEFLAPVFFGDTVHVKTICISKSPSGRKSGKIVWERQLINQDDKIVQRGLFKTLVALNPETRKQALSTSKISDVDQKSTINPALKAPHFKNDAVNAKESQSVK